MKLGIALSGGGVRSAAQLGIMQALIERGIKPTIFTGTSGGSIVATLLALGNTPEEALKKYKMTNDVLDIAYWQIIKAIFTRSHVDGIYKGDKLEKILEQIFERKGFANIGDVKLAVITTNINDGKQVIFSNHIRPDESLVNDDNFSFVPSWGTELSFAVSASTRLPAIFIPKPFTNISMGDKFLKFEQMSLIDGGIVNNLPSDIALSLGADKVIAIDLGYTGKARAVNGLYPILKQSIDVMQERVVDSNMKNTGIYLNPEIFDVKVLDLDKIDECFERGYEYGKSVADKVLREVNGDAL